MTLFRLAIMLFALAALAAGLFVSAIPIEAAAPKSTREKIDRMSSGKMRPGETIVVSDGEITAFIASGEVEVPEGVSEVAVQFRPETAIVDSTVDLAKTQEANGKSLNMLMRMLLEGERRLRTTCRYTSADGMGTLDIQSFEIDGAKIDGSMLDFLLKNLVSPNYPDLKLGEPQELPKGIGEIRLEEGRMVVVGG